VTPVVTNRVLFHDKDRRLLQDVVTCIREKTTIDDVGFKRDRHADRYLKAPPRCCGSSRVTRRPIAASVAIAARCRFSPGRADLPVSPRGRRARQDRPGDPGAPDLGRRGPSAFPTA
jgi:DNA polymerase III alpha subunit